jgi:argininosuccinate lyase
MPHKKNPDVLELTRAKCNQLATTAPRIQFLLANMQSGYHRDFQLLKEILFPEIDRMQDVLDIVTYCIPIIEEREDIMKDEKYKLCYTVENINARVKSGEAFRDAYHAVKKEVNENSFVPLKKVEHSHIGSLGNLGIERIKQKLDLT